MRGYLNFNLTGIEEIDEIIEQLEYAGNSYHGTEYWADEAFGCPGSSHIDLIQKALNNAADKIKQQATKLAGGMLC